MNYFNGLWNLLIGIIGGIISSIIVSRIFLIQNDYQEQINKFETLMFKLGYTGGIFAGSKIVLEVSYDSQIDMEKEMKKEGFKTEEEYYFAHKEKDWISKEKLLNDLIKNIKKVAEQMENEMMNISISEKGLFEISKMLNDSIRKMLNVKECTFSTIREIEKVNSEINDKYKKYKKDYKKILLKLILKDKIMICLYLFILFIVTATIITYKLNI